MELKEKVLNGAYWNTISSILIFSSEFLVGIYFARTLGPKIIGLFGLISVFIAISELLINSGFSQALIRADNCTNIQYSTVFVINLTIATILYIVLYNLAPLISDIYNEKQLVLVIRLVSLSLIINAFSLIYKVSLQKNLEFKSLSRINISAVFFSNITAFVLSIFGFGFLAFFLKNLIRDFVNLFFFIYKTRWLPSFEINLNSVKDMFSFGMNLLISGVLTVIVEKSYYLFIGKFWSKVQLGLFQRGESFVIIIVNNIMSILTNISFPTLSLLKDNPNQFASVHRHIFSKGMYVIFFGLTYLYFISDELVLFLLGKSWVGVTPFLKLFIIQYVFISSNSLNILILNIFNRSDLYLKIQIISLLGNGLNILFGFYTGFNFLIYGMILNAVMISFLIGYFVNRFSNYQYFEQLKYQLLIILNLACVCLIIFFILEFLSNYLIINLLIKIVLFPIVYLSVFTITKNETAKYINQLVVNKFKSIAFS